MEYVWFVAVGLVVGLVVGRFLSGNNFGVQGDILFAVIGALVGGVALGVTGLVPEGGQGGRVALAAMGAFIALALRRALRTV
jgi:uncharacterized membrane protein YeaQ/YmgE (transglycosylase-associated protein family)